MQKQLMESCKSFQVPSLEPVVLTDLHLLAVLARAFGIIYPTSWTNPNHKENRRNKTNTVLIWVFPKMVVPPISSILIGFSIINHPFWGTPIFGNTHVLNSHMPWAWPWATNTKKQYGIPSIHGPKHLLFLLSVPLYSNMVSSILQRGVFGSEAGPFPIGLRKEFSRVPVVAVPCPS